MRRHLLHHVIAFLVLALLVFPASGATPDSSSSTANACSRYLILLMRSDETHFDKVSDCTTYAAHGGVLRIGQSDPTITTRADGFTVTFNPIGGYAVTNVVPGSTVSFSAAAGWGGFYCEAMADASGNVPSPCMSYVSPGPNGQVPAIYTATLVIRDLTTNVIVVEMNKSYPN